MSRLLFLLLAVTIGLFSIKTPTSAHVLITDNTGSIGAILHVNPDDDPIADQPSSLFFDIQDQAFSKHPHDVKLEIINEQGTKNKLDITVAGSSVSAKYTFPEQGVYKIVLTAAAKGSANAHEHTFTHTQRVSRGVSGSVLDKPAHEWAEATLIIGICGFLTLMTIGFNRRKSIAAHSKF